MTRPNEERSTYRRLGERIRELLRQRDMRQKDLAEALSVSGSWLNQVIHGEKPSLELIRRIDAFMGITPELEDMLREARTPHARREPAVSIQANARPQAGQFFYTWEARPEFGFVNAIADARRVCVFSRTAVNVLGLYHRAIERRMEGGCDFRFLLVRREADRSRLVYGTNPEAFAHNQAVARAMLKRLLSSFGDRVLQVRVTALVPTFAMLIAEHEDAADDLIQVQLYFVHGPTTALDRPVFSIRRDDPWYDVFRDEFTRAWDAAEGWSSSAVQPYPYGEQQ